MVITRKAGAMKKRRLAALKRNKDNAKIAELRAIRAQIVAGTYVPPSQEPETDEADEAEGSEGGQDGQGGSETGDNGSGGQDTGNGSEGGQDGSQDGQGSQDGSGENGSGETGEKADEKSPLDQWSEAELQAFIEQNGGRFDRRWGKLRLVEEAKKHA